MRGDMLQLIFFNLLQRSQLIKDSSRIGNLFLIHFLFDDSQLEISPECTFLLLSIFSLESLILLRRILLTCVLLIGFLVVLILA